jgi:predicted metal-dependent phosphoesterase TrpH
MSVTSDDLARAPAPAGGRARRRTGIIHIHSDYSRDGCDSLEGLRRFALERGIGFIAMSDHAEDFTSVRFAEYVAHCATVSDEQVTVIPGLEYRFAGLPGLHLLAFGLRDWIEPATPAAFIELASVRCGMTVLAHPLLARYRIPDVVRTGIDAVEVWNAAYNTRYLPDPRSIQLVQALRRSRPRVVATAGLDQHDASNDRQLRVVLDVESANPLTELRAGRFTNVGRMLTFDAWASYRPYELLALTAARWVLDGVNQVHDHVVRLRRSRHSAPPA